MPVNTISGTKNADTLVGTNDIDHMFGGGGDDLLETSDTGGEHDILHGGAGNDTVRGGGGRAYGGSGNDIVSGPLAFGGVGDDIVNGDYAFGGSGNDTVYTRDGAAYGGLGDDHVSAYYKSQLFGGDGQDMLTVTGGENTLTGGAQADVFHFTLQYDTARAVSFSMEDNVITDFQSGVDKIQLGILRGVEFDHDMTTKYADQEDGFYWEEITLTAEGNDTRLSANATVWGDSYSIDVLIKNIAPADLSQDDFIFPAAVTEIQGSQQSDELRGTRTNNILKGLAGDDTLNAYAGDDVLFGGAGNDVLLGGDGADILNGGAGWDKLFGGAGADTFVFDSSTAWREKVYFFEVGTDIIRLNGTDATGFGDLTFANTTLNDTDGVIVNYGNGSAFLLGATKAEIANSSNFVFGNDPVAASPSPIGQSVQQEAPFAANALNIIKGTSGDDTLTGGESDDKIFGYGGNDAISDHSGNNTLYGGTGEDYVRGQGALYGNQGNDSLSGGGSLYGGLGDDLLYATDTATLFGGNGADVFQIATNDPTETVEIADFQVGLDKINLGGRYEGYSFFQDEVTLTQTGADVHVIAQFDPALGPNLSRIDLLIKNVSLDNLSFDDFLLLEHSATTNGTNGSDTLSGSRSNDIMNGHKGADKLSGGMGDDQLFGGGHADQLYGEEGNDRLWGAWGADALFGEEGNDILYGQFGLDTLFGGDGNDRLLGGANDDTLFGGNGDDRLLGGANDDILFGGNGDDVLTGGKGWDILIGGYGADVFVFDASKGWRERVLDFETGTDMIRLKGTTATQFSDLEMQEATLEEGDGVLVNFGNGSVFLLDTTLDAINDAANFEFV